jgi:hypothetical protein
VASTDGSTFDTVLRIYDDCDGEEVMCDDDGGEGLTSELRFETTAGQTMLFVIDGYSPGSWGDFEFTILACEEEEVAEIDGSSTYSGTLTIDVEASFLFVSMSDVCEGTIEVLVDMTADPQIEAVGSCSFSGELEEHFPGTYHGDLTGHVFGPPGAAGDLYVDLGADADPIDTDWNGSLMDTFVSGSFTDEITFDAGIIDADVEFTGSFYATLD